MRRSSDHSALTRVQPGLSRAASSSRDFFGGFGLDLDFGFGFGLWAGGAGAEELVRLTTVGEVTAVDDVVAGVDGTVAATVGRGGRCRGS